jgi:hypothetical protein
VLIVCGIPAADYPQLVVLHSERYQFSLIW